MNDRAALPRARRSKGSSKPPRTTTSGKKKAVPVTLLSGFLGAGKTTLLEHILKNREGIRCALVVNDMAELNIDASLVKGSHLLQSKEKMVELHNGCICCTLRKDLLVELRKLARSDKFDVIIIESTGISEPMQVAETFFMDVADGKGLLNEVARLDNCVTVVDPTTFVDYLHSMNSVLDEYPDTEMDKADERNISHLLVDQIEFANVVVVNKLDVATPEQVKETLATIRALNPTAKVIQTTRSRVNLKEMLFTNAFTLEYAVRATGWMAEIHNGIPHTPETEEYGISSFVYRATKPFHPKRLYDWVTQYFFLQELAVVPEDEEEDHLADDNNGNSLDAGACAEGDNAAAPPTLPSSETNHHTTATNHKGSGKRPRDYDDRPSHNTTLHKEEEAKDNAASECHGAIQQAENDVAKDENGHQEASAAAAGGGEEDMVARCRNDRTKHIGNVLRSKGYVWIGSPSRRAAYGEWGQAGNLLLLGLGGLWDSFPETVAKDRENTTLIEKEPCQELVFIGQSLKKDVIQNELDACLLTSEEQRQFFNDECDGASPFEDPFEDWGVVVGDDGEDE